MLFAQATEGEDAPRGPGGVAEGAPAPPPDPGERALQGPPSQPAAGGPAPRGRAPAAIVDPAWIRMTLDRRTRRGFAPPADQLNPLDSSAAGPGKTTEEPNLTNFLTDYGVVVALVCAGAAVVYGLLDHPAPARPVAWERADAGNLGRRAGRCEAYLNRQYTIIACVAIPLRDPALVLQDVQTAIGFVIGGVLSGAHRLHRHEPLGAGQRPRRRGGPRRRAAGARRRLQGRLGHRAAGRRPGAARRRRLLRRSWSSPAAPTRRPSTR